MLHNAPGRAFGPMVVLALFGVALDGAAASCAAPSVRADSRRARPGDALVITGTGWNDTCNDTGGGTFFGCSDESDSDHPTEGIDVDIQKLGEPVRERVVENVDADDEFRLRVMMIVPDLPPGRYKLIVHDRGRDGYPLPLRIVDTHEGTT